MSTLLLTLVASSLPLGGDTIELKKTPDESTYEVHFYNNGLMDSINGEVILTLGDVQVTVRVKVGHDGPETFYVTPGPSTVLIPIPESMEVNDGDVGVILLYPPMF